jgi:hypothetical protein
MTTESQLPNEQDNITRAILERAEQSDHPPVPLTSEEREAIAFEGRCRARRIRNR